MRKNFILISLMLGCSLLVLRPAGAAIHLGASAGLDFVAATLSGEGQKDGKIGYQVGIFGNRPVGRAWGVELGLYSLRRGLELGKNDASERHLAWTSFHVPFLFQLRTFETLTLGAGIDYGIGQGQVRDKTNNEDLNYSEAGLDQNEWNWVGQVRAKVPITSFLIGVGEARYIHGITEQSKTDANQLYYRDLQLLVGAMIKI